MKYIYLILFAVLLNSSCKKCVQCENRCFNCTGVSKPTICSNDYTKSADFVDVIQALESQGFTCAKIAPTRDYSICDNKQTTDNFKYLLETQNYICK